ncbi:MAG: nucleotide excision repair endonuclease, partial [Candidatus Polarisedimenticolia bacterium]
MPGPPRDDDALRIAERIADELRRAGGPRSSADLARRFLGLGFVDEALADRLLSPLREDPRFARGPDGWTLRDHGPAYAAAPPLDAPFVALFAPRDVPVAASFPCQGGGEARPEAPSRGGSTIAAASPPADDEETRPAAPSRGGSTIAAASPSVDDGESAPRFVVAAGGAAEAQRAAERLGRTFPARVVDLAQVFRRLRGYRGPSDPLRLAEACNAPHLDDETPEARAAQAAAAWRTIAAELAAEGLADLGGLDRLLDAALEAGDWADRAFGPDDLAALPAGPGVYLFRDAARRALYVGQSSNLAVRVNSYFWGPPRDFKDRELRAKARTLTTRAVDTAPDALLLEARWIKSRRPALNTRLDVRGGAGEEGVLALRGPVSGRVVFFVLRDGGLVGRFAATPRRARAAARQAAAALCGPSPETAPDREAAAPGE